MINDTCKHAIYFAELTTTYTYTDLNIRFITDSQPNKLHSLIKICPTVSKQKDVIVQTT